MDSIWTGSVNTCGDGQCDSPFEFPAYGDKGCETDCGLHTVQVGPLYPILVLLKGDFSNSALGRGNAESLASTVTWNLCLRDENRREAGLEDVCWYEKSLAVDAQMVGTFPFTLPAGQWYLSIVGDYYNILTGSVYDSSNPTSLRELTVSPEWYSCEVGRPWADCVGPCFPPYGSSLTGQLLLALLEPSAVPGQGVWNISLHCEVAADVELCSEGMRTKGVLAELTAVV